MILAQAMLAPGDHFCAASKRLAVEPRIWGRPVEILAGQHVAAELSVIGHPVGPVIIMGRPHNRGLVCPELRALVWEPGDEESGHAGVAFQPQLYVCDWRLRRSPSWQLAPFSCRWLIDPNQVQYLFHCLRREGCRWVVWTQRG